MSHSHDPDVQRATRAADRRPRTSGARRRSSQRRRLITRVITLIAIALVFAYVVHALRADPRDARAIAERELRVNTLQPGEQVHRVVSVFKRSAISYFRATRGLLALTDRRLVYLGVEPRDLLAAPDLPPTFEQREFALDTSLHVTSGRTLLGLVRAIDIQTPSDHIKLGVPSSATASADLLISTLAARRDRAVAEAAQRGATLKEVAAERRAAEAQRRKPRYYTVQRGDALGGIATIWNTTTDRLRQWNHLSGNQIRAGQSLLVRPGF